MEIVIELFGLITDCNYMGRCGFFIDKERESLHFIMVKQNTTIYYCDIKSTLINFK